MMHRVTTVILVLALSLVSLPGRTADPAEVLLFGTFHFKDAGLDMVKVEDINIMSEENQAYLEGLTTRLASWSPTHVMLEYDPANEETINERYRAYLEGEFELPANEIYQLGFRIAKQAGLERVHSFDHRELHWAAEPLFEYAEAHDAPEMKRMREAIASAMADEERVRGTLDLAQLLARSNDPERDRMNMDLYLMTNPVGAEDGWSGADATMTWWGRNFRMYAKIQQQATPGNRVIAIGGSGHMAILKQLLAIDRRLEAEDPVPYLEAGPIP